MANLQMNKQELNTDLKQKLKNRQFLGENICKWYNWQGLNFQNIQTDNATQKKKKQLAADLNRHFSNEDIQMANRCSTLLTITEKQIKTT